MFKAQKGSKNIIKIVHVTSVVQPKCYEATRILFVRQVCAGQRAHGFHQNCITCVLKMNEGLMGLKNMRVSN